MYCPQPRSAFDNIPAVKSETSFSDEQANDNIGPSQGAWDPEPKPPYGDVGAEEDRARAQAQFDAMIEAERRGERR